MSTYNPNEDANRSDSNEPGGSSPGNNPYPPPPPPIFNDPPPPQFGDPITSNPPPPGAPPLTPGTAYGNPPSPNTGGLTKEERNWAMFAHVSALVVGLVMSALTAGHAPFLGFLGPLVIYLMKKDESAFIADQAKEALNFNISVSIILVALIILTFTVILAILTIPGIFVVSLAALVLVIIAAIKSSNGEWYRYPFTLRLIK